MGPCPHLLPVHLRRVTSRLLNTICYTREKWGQFSVSNILNLQQVVSLNQRPRFNAGMIVHHSIIINDENYNLCWIWYFIVHSITTIHWYYPVNFCTRKKVYPVTWLGSRCKWHATNHIDACWGWIFCKLAYFVIKFPLSRLLCRY